MVIRKFLLVALVLCVGVRSQHPSTAEFNLFCRIWTEANDMMLEPGYVYDEEKDKEIVKEMQVLFNATTDNMEDFRKMLWVTKDFFQEHPPPTHSESRKRAHREIAQLIGEGEKKIEENRGLAKEVNEKIEAAKLSAAQGFYGDHVKKVPEKDGNITEILGDTGNIFNHKESPGESCGNKGKAGKTLINDFFCVCVGDGKTDSEPPCSPHILPPKRGGGSDGWKAMKFKSSKNLLPFGESIKKIEEVCKETLDETSRKNILGLLQEYLRMIERGPAKKEAKGKKIFGHSGRKESNKVTQCTGYGGGSGGDTFDKEAKNADMCVDYTNNQNQDGQYEIPWHEKFKNYTTFMKEAKSLEDQILKNRAALLLLKSEAWIAYSREKDDETSNLDDMNASDKKDTMAEKKTDEREYIDVSEETTQPSQPSQPVQGQGAPGNPPHYILISSTETSQPSPKKTDEGKGGGREEPEVTVISSESTTQEAASPSQGPSQATSQPPTQSAKRLREENKTGE